MNKMERINGINKIIVEYFSRNPSINIVMAKDLMPDFIREGIFIKDNKNGLPIRQLLRDLDDNNLLHLIPTVLVEKKESNRNWYFLRPGGSTGIKEIHKSEATYHTKIQTSAKRLNSDESYVLDLCDEILGINSLRQHHFAFLLGDPGKNGICRKLPVDAYYPQLKLVVEFRERQHSEKVSFFNKPNRITVSGVNRGEQRKVYDQRRRDLLPKNGIRLIEISYSDFQYNTTKKIIRNPVTDLEKLKGIFNMSGISTEN